MKHVKNPNDIVDEYVKDHLDILGDNIQSIIMYGSAVTHEFIPGKSDVNMLILLKNDSLDNLLNISHLQQKWCKRGVAVPFYLSEKFIIKSLHIFPLEVLDIKENYRVLQGIDVLNAIEIDKQDIFLQCERELKGFSIQLRRSSINLAQNEKQLFQLAADSMKDLIPVLKGIIALYDETIPNSKSEIVAKIEDLMNLGASSLSEVFNIANSVKKIDIKELLYKYCSDVDTIISIMEELSVADFTQKDMPVTQNVTNGLS